MPTTIASIPARVRQDLHAKDAAAYRWTDAVLDRHIGRAANEYSLHDPREQKNTLTTTAGSRDISVSTLTDLIDPETIRAHLEAFQTVADGNGGTRATGTPGFDASVEHVRKLVAEIEL